MADDFAPPGRLAGTGEYDPASAEFAELRELLQRSAASWTSSGARMDALGITPEELSRCYRRDRPAPGRDRQLARALVNVENSHQRMVGAIPEIATRSFLGWVTHPQRYARANGRLVE